MRWWNGFGLKLKHWRTLIVCEFAGHRVRRRVRFNSRGGMWQEFYCERCGGVVQ